MATGTAPFVIASTTAVSNLNADLLDGNHAAAFYLATNPSGYTTNTGTVTSVAAGAGLNFTTFTTSGTITMGTPSSLTDATTNSASGTTHTHAITNYSLSGTTNQITVTGAGKVLGAATTLSLPQNIHTTADVTFNSLNVKDLTVTGTLLTKDAQQVNIGDAIILLNAEEAATPSENAGIEVERGNKFVYSMG